MNRGNYLGIIFAILMFGFSYYFLTFLFQVPSMALLLGFMAFFCFTAGEFSLIYSSLFEGNTYLRRRFGGENVGIGILIEQAAYWRFYQIDLSKSKVKLEEEDFVIMPSHIGYRKGGSIPYVAFKKGTGQSIDLSELKPALTSELTTQWLMNESNIAALMAADMMKNRLFMYTMIGFVIVGLLTIVGIYFGASASGGATQSGSICQSTLTECTKALATVTPSAGGIPHA